MTNIIGIVVEPVQPGKTDNLVINQYEQLALQYLDPEYTYEPK